MDVSAYVGIILDGMFAGVVVAASIFTLLLTVAMAKLSYRTFFGS